ncbi:MAG TPA: hypothetical protein VKU02_18465 [Gemmataceae bacterium]|nr:hypothetical protein [Gemmataceae bacterium]
MFRLMLVLLLGGPILAWFPVKLPVAVRKIAACLALVPATVALVFVSGVWLMRPRQLAWPALPLILLFGMMVAAGAYSMWPGERSRKKCLFLASSYVGLILILFTLAGAVVYARGGTVFGTVTFKGQALPSGKVSILSESGVVCSGDIGPNGRYIVYRVPSGRVKMAVATYPPPPPGPVPTTASKYLPIPRRYREFDTSALTDTVTHGGQVRDIELEP